MSEEPPITTTTPPPFVPPDPSPSRPPPPPPPPTESPDSPSNADAAADAPAAPLLPKPPPSPFFRTPSCAYFVFGETDRQFSPQLCYKFHFVSLTIPIEVFIVNFHIEFICARSSVIRTHLGSMLGMRGVGGTEEPTELVIEPDEPAIQPLPVGCEVGVRYSYPESYDLGLRSWRVPVKWWNEECSDVLRAYFYGQKENRVEIVSEEVREAVADVAKRWKLRDLAKILRDRVVVASRREEQKGEVEEDVVDQQQKQILVSFAPNEGVLNAVATVMYPSLERGGGNFDLIGSDGVAVRIHREIMMMHSAMFWNLMISAPPRSHDASRPLPNFVCHDLRSDELRAVVDHLYKKKKTLSLSFFESEDPNEILESLERLSLFARCHSMSSLADAIVGTLSLSSEDQDGNVVLLTRETAMRIYMSFRVYLKTHPEFEGAVLRELLQACGGQKDVLRRFVGGVATVLGRSARKKGEGIVRLAIENLGDIRLSAERLKVRIDKMLMHLEKANLQEKDRVTLDFERVPEEILVVQTKNADLQRRLASLPSVDKLALDIGVLETRLAESSDAQFDLEDQVSRLKGEIIVAHDRKKRYEKELAVTHSSLLVLFEKKEHLESELHGVDQKRAEHVRLREDFRKVSKTYIPVAYDDVLIDFDLEIQED